MTTLTTWPREAAELFDRAVVCEYASLTRDGRPVTWPVTPYVGAGGTLDVTTGLTYPDKAERARRDPRVALLYSSAEGSGLDRPPVVLVQGRAAVRDADLQANTDRYVRDSLAKTGSGFAGMPWFLTKRLGWYFARIYVEVTPERIVWWPEGDLSGTPEVWTRPGEAAAPVSDPAPNGPRLPSRPSRRRTGGPSPAARPAWASPSSPWSTPAACRWPCAPARPYAPRRASTCCCPRASRPSPGRSASPSTGTAQGWSGRRTWCSSGPRRGRATGWPYGSSEP
ncbi:pyridoxamine 5'-phosphate oxidase family protein [Microbispora sp. GKU 823]|uniref:pyridoxamine 5'-phosphate oxidase family protein n=1 Tax=Microbispora sp. GKU 823 TaxID=1652100 RepID=UPI001C4DE6CE|nr:pyridoxamine 5'-phosphate oxidase family protein [Microbispora sp. GKU 823]